MGINNKILLGVIAATFTAGIGTAYAGPLNPLVILSGDVVITGETELEGKLLDANDEAGISGQILSSTGTGIDWINTAEVTDPILMLLNDSDFGLEAIKNSISESEPLSKLEIEDFRVTSGGFKQFEATSDKQFIVEACGWSHDPEATLQTFRGSTSGSNLFTVHKIGNIDGDCTTIGGNPNDTIIIFYFWNSPESSTLAGTMTLRTTPSAQASIIPL